MRLCITPIICIIFNVQEYMVGAQEGLVIMSAAMIIVATIIMARGIIKGLNSANMIPWLIWSAVTAVTLAAMQSKGATRWEIIVPLSQLFSMFVIMLTTAVVIFARGGWRKERIRRGDGFALIICIVFVGAGLFFDEPYVTLWGNFAANLVGLVPIYREGRADPANVTRWYWIFRGFSTVAATAAFMVDGLRLAGLIPSGVGLIIVASMLWASVERPKRTPARVLMTVRTEDRYPMLTIGGTFFR